MSDGMTVPFPDELLHLEEINMKLKEALEKAEESVRKSEREYMDTKRYMVEHRGDIDPHEMFQNEMLLKQTDRSGAFAVERRDRIVKIKESPYFARIDFREESRKTDIISGGLRSIMKINRLYSTGVPLYPACFMISMWEKPDYRLRTALFSGR